MQIPECKVPSVSPLMVYDQEGELVEEVWEGPCVVCGLEDEADDEADEGMAKEEAQQPDRLALEKDGEVVKKLLNPLLPSAEEVERHKVSGHIPYRSWCPVCVKARGKEMGHARGSGEARGRKLPEYSMDYCFPGDELGYKWTVL